MPHRERYMQQVAPDRWVVKCNVCPKTGDPFSEYDRGKRIFSSARQCHDWWRWHVETDVHRRRLHPRARELAFDEWFRSVVQYRSLMHDIYGDDPGVFDVSPWPGPPGRQRRTLPADFDPEASITWREAEDSETDVGWYDYIKNRRVQHRGDEFRFPG